MYLTFFVLDHEILKDDLETVIGVGGGAVQANLQNCVFHNVGLSDLHPIKAIFGNVDFQSRSNFLTMNLHDWKEEEGNISVTRK